MLFLILLQPANKFSFRRYREFALCRLAFVLPTGKEFIVLPGIPLACREIQATAVLIDCVFDLVSIFRNSSAPPFVVISAASMR